MTGDKIKKIRVSLGLTQQQFADKISSITEESSISKGTVNNWEHNRNLPNKKRIVAISTLGGVTVNYLLGIKSFAEKKKIVSDIILNSYDPIYFGQERPKDIVIDALPYWDEVYESIDDDTTNYEHFDISYALDYYLGIKYKKSSQKLYDKFNQFEKKYIDNNESIDTDEEKKFITPTLETIIKQFIIPLTEYLNKSKIPEFYNGGSNFTIKRITRWFFKEGDEYLDKEEAKKEVPKELNSLRELSLKIFSINGKINSATELLFDDKKIYEIISRNKVEKENPNNKEILKQKVFLKKKINEYLVEYDSLLKKYKEQINNI